MKLRKSMLLLPCALGLAVSAGYGLRVYAEGAPTTKPIFYAGTLESGGMLAKGPHTIALTLYDAETAGTSLCTSETPGTPVDNGRFRVEVSPACVAAMKAKPDVWAQMEFTGEDNVVHRLPVRSKVGAVPYAMEAQHAVSASSAVTAATAANATEAQHAASATTVTEPTFLGFSSHNAVTFTKASGWGPVVLETVDFNTLGNVYNASSGVFTARRAGYYRFSAFGHSVTATTGTDLRTGFCFMKNGVLSRGMSGGQLSAVDSPLPAHTEIVKLAVDDTIQPYLFSAIQIVVNPAGAGSAGIWFQAEYLGE